MAAADFDVIFTKALRLLHSKSKDSADQLRAMLDEALAQRQGNAINQVKQVSILLILTNTFKSILFNHDL